MDPYLRKRPLEVTDYFMWAAEHPGLSGAVDEFKDAERTLASFCVTLPQPASDRVRVGLIYAKRAYSEDRPEDLLIELAEVRRRASDDPELMILARAVEAVVLLMRCRRYGESLALLEGLHRELRFGGRDIAYGIVRRGMALALMFLARHSEAEVAYQDALVVFRRYDHTLSVAAILGDYAIIKKRLGCYAEAAALLREAIRRYDEVGVMRGKVQAVVNLGLVEARSGNWSAAEKYYRKTQALLSSGGLDETSNPKPQFASVCKINLEHLDLLRRRFAHVQDKLHATFAAETDNRLAAILCEYLADLYTETENYDKADEYLQKAYTITQEILPESDVMTEVLRRQAQLALNRDQLSESKSTALRCILLSKKIGDRYELGAATRVLGEVYAAQGNVKRARACFATAIHGLKSIHECYELMRALYAQGVFYARRTKRDEAEISLLEARQLAKKLELDYYQALIAIALVDVLTPQERWNEASTWLAEATALRDNLEGIDRERVEKGLQRSANELQQAITRASVREAETLKTICRVYEDARFPIAEMKPDLAYQVAQSVGGECLFVVGRKGSGFTVPLTYNIAVNEAKEIVRQLDARPKKPLFGLDSGPQVMMTQNARTLVAVPCFVTPNGAGNKAAELYAFCTRFDGMVTITPRQMELLYASSEALARLIEDEGDRHAKATPEEQERVRHPRGSFKDILTIDADMIKLIKVAERAAGSVAPILLEGETGVGKELFARAIHGASKRKEGPFVAVNAGGMSVSLLESELFGHVRGAFTDASSDRLGFIESARGGTLFLDEVGEMSEELQVKLLRLLESGEYRRLGESSVRKADARVISATNRDLKKEVDRGDFRRDLYYRVAPLRLTIPPLRMRTCDIQLMVRHFLRDCAQLNGIADRYIEIDVKAMEALELYDWPGNVRELYNEILRVVSLIGRGDLVRFTMLSEGIQDYLQAKKRGTDGLLERSVEQYERRLILHALEKHDWNHLRTAEAIGVPRTTLLAKLKRLNVASK